MLLGKKYNPQDYASIVWRRRWLVVWPTVIGVFVALVICSRLTDLYQSDMLIQVVPQRVPDSFVRSTVTVRVEERLQALSQQLTSRTQLEQMINEFNLYPGERSRLPMEDVVEMMRARIDLEVDSVRRGSRGEGGDAFRIRFTHSDPNIAARITQRLGSSIVDQNARDRGALAEATNDFLESELAQARTRLEAHERKLEQFRMRNAGRLPSQLEFNLQAMQSTQLQVQSLVESLARDRDRKMILDRLFTDARTEPAPVPVAPAPQAGDADAATARMSRQQQLELAKARLARLEQRLTPEHPDMVRAKRVIADLEKQIQEGTEAESASPDAVSTPEQQARRDRLRQMRAELESLDRQIAFKQSEEQRLRQRVGEYQRRIEAVPGIESESISLTRDYDTL
ncbi:MAG: GumC family protein, partial [Vicinamibacterales bacterium]